MADIPELPSVPSIDQAKKRQYLVLAGVAVLIAVVGLGTLLMDAPGTPPTKSKSVTRDLKAPGQTISDQEVWIAKSEQRFKANEDLLRELQNKNKVLEVANSDLAARVQGGRIPSSLTGAVPPPMIPASSAASGAVQPLPPPPPYRVAGAGTTPSGMPSGPYQKTTPNQATSPSGGIFKVSLAAKTAGNPVLSGVTDASADSEKTERRRVGTWVPAGSFTRAVMLGGLDAPTGGQAQHDPHPVVMRLQDNSMLPNRFRTRTKECHLVGAGYGDIASERAYIRLETLSCVLKSGQVIETPVSGYVAGEDGKTGMRGRLVSKEGQLVAKGLIAGLLAGIGGGFAQTRTTLSTSPLGSTQTVDPSKIFEFGAYQGIGKAMDRLAQYYISMAEKIFPIVEIDAGRVVDAVFTKGVALDGDINNQASMLSNEEDI